MESKCYLNDKIWMYSDNQKDKKRNRDQTFVSIVAAFEYVE